MPLINSLTRMFLMSDEFLAKVKGFNRTLVVHSTNGLHLAAAAMGKMVARSNEEGSYFQVSDHFIPNVDSLASDDPNIDSDPNQIYADFKNDWENYLRFCALPACGLKYKDSCTPQKNTLRYINAHFRRIPAIKVRTPHESPELSIPSEFQTDYERLITLIRTGGDLKPYLSRDILKNRRPDRNDGLLNSWGIQHLHFRSEGTQHILFCVITETDVFIIQALNHGMQHLWVNTQLFQILHDNWPELIAAGKLNGASPEMFSAARRFSMRSYNTNFPTTVSDGTVYLPPTGGTVASGDAHADWVKCDKIYIELEYWESFITREALAIRTALNMPESQKLIVRMAYDHQVCCFYEATRGIRLSGFAS